LRLCHFTLLCHGDRLWLIALRAREIERQDPVLVFGLDPVRVNFDQEGHCTIETSGQPLAAMEASLFALFDRFGAGKADGSVLDLDLQVGLSDPRKFGDNDNVLALAKDI